MELNQVSGRTRTNDGIAVLLNDQLERGGGIGV